MAKTRTMYEIAEELQDKAAKVLKILGDPNRIKIVEILRGGELCQCEIIPLIGQSQPTVSRHLSLLEENGIIISRKAGVRVLYQIQDPRILELLDIASTL